MNVHASHNPARNPPNVIVWLLRPNSRRDPVSSDRLNFMLVSGHSYHFTGEPRVKNEENGGGAYLVGQDTQHWLGDRVIPVIMRDLPGCFAVLVVKN